MWRWRSWRSLPSTWCVPRLPAGRTCGRGGRRQAVVAGRQAVVAGRRRAAPAVPRPPTRQPANPCIHHTHVQIAAFLRSRASLCRTTRSWRSGPRAPCRCAWHAQAVAATAQRLQRARARARAPSARFDAPPALPPTRRRSRPPPIQYSGPSHLHPGAQALLWRLWLRLHQGHREEKAGWGAGSGACRARWHSPCLACARLEPPAPRPPPSLLHRSCLWGASRSWALRPR